MSYVDKSNIVKIMFRGHDQKDVDWCISDKYRYDYDNFYDSNFEFPSVDEDKRRVIDEWIKMHPENPSSEAALKDEDVQFEIERTERFVKELNENALKVVEYAYGFEYPDEECNHEHTHVVIRVSEALKDDIKLLRQIWDLDNHPNIQDIRLGDDWRIATEYACKQGNYCWPSRHIPEPWDVERPVWYECQERILAELDEQNKREILCVVDPVGNSGKTFLMKWLSLRFKAVILPISNNYRDVMRFAFDLNKHHKVLHTVFIDVPRAFPKTNLRALYSAIETLKDGTIWDDRWELDMRIDLAPPKICVMLNDSPDFNYLTQDRWKVLNIRADGSVVMSRAPAMDWIDKQNELRKQRHREAQRRYQARKDAIRDKQKISTWAEKIKN